MRLPSSGMRDSTHSNEEVKENGQKSGNRFFVMQSLSSLGAVEDAAFHPLRKVGSGSPSCNRIEIPSFRFSPE